MVSIALRAYLNEINDMIDHRQIEEAISHCRHILERYPKHVDTYRLLGKAYLEEQRYGDAADILQRVLSSVPEDFISHVGMSIIREDEGNIDAAIYHMERAFENQPSNHAIQDELRRLIGLRDGVEPPRIRLTRGALARMYAHGHLYDQAIAELRAAISEDPQRLDLMTLLAEMYDKADKQVDAAETCTKILEKLPYCLSANQILVQILTAKDRQEEADRYRNRWEDLDPYAELIGKDFAKPEQVPDDMVKIDKLDWEPGSALPGGDRPAWAASLGVSIEDEEEELDETLPEWLTSEGDEDETEITPEFEAAELDEGYTTEEPSAEETQFEEGEEEAEPDWMAASDEEEFGLFSEEEPDEEEALPDFLMEAEDEAEEEDDWLASLEAAEEDTSQTVVTPEPDEDVVEDEDDWLASLETPEDTAPTSLTEDDEEEEEDWLASLESAEEDTSQTAAISEPDEDMVEDDDAWLASLESPEDTAPTSLTEHELESEEEEEAWLASLESASEEVPVETEETPSEEDEIPDFMREAGWEKSTGELESEEPMDYFKDEAEDIDDEIEEGEIPDWLRDMAPSEEGKPETESKPSDITAEPDPDWLQELDSQVEAEAPDWLRELDEEPEEDVVEALQEEAESKEIEADDEDMAWLESLAAKQGIPEEEMVTSPEQRAQVDETHLPESLITEDGAEETGLEEEVPGVVPLDEVPDTEKPVQEDVEELEEEGWLAGLEEETEVDEEEVDWLAGLEAEAEEPTAGVSPEPVLEDEDDFDMDWLDEIGQEAAQEAAETSLEDKVTEEEDWLTSLGEEAEEDEEEVDWLAGLEPEAEEPAVEVSPEPVLEDEDDFDMDWLDEIGQEAAQEAAETSLEEETPEEPEEDLAPAFMEDQEEEAEEEDWLAGLEEDREEDEEEVDWLAGLEAEEEEPAEEPTAGVSLEPVLEDEDDFDMDWLDEIGQEAAQEAAETSLEEEKSEEPTPAFMEEEEEDWLASLGEEAEETAEEPALESAPETVLEEEDDFDTGWLDEIGQEAAQEAADTSLEEEAPVEPEAEEQPEEVTAPWLSTVAEETDSDQELLEDETIAQFISHMDEEQPPEEVPTEEEPSEEVKQEESIEPAHAEADQGDMDWLEQAVQEDAETLDETEEEQEVLGDTIILGEADDWLSELGEDELVTTAEEEAPELEEVGDWDALAEAEEPVEEAGEAFQEEETPTVGPPTPTDEWVPEALQDIPFEEEPAEEPIEVVPEDAIPSPDPTSPEGMLETARNLVEQGSIEDAAESYSRLIKKGKKVPEVIEDLKEAIQRHPVNSQLWQLLGDAFQRMDNLQEALDAYTKAEELLR